MNNGKRIDRFNSKKIRKEVLSAGNLQALLQGGLLQFDFDGEIKVVPSSNPGWLLIDNGDNGGVNPPPINTLQQYTFYSTGSNLVEAISVWILGAIQLGKTPYTNQDGTGLLENGTYGYLPVPPAVTPYDVVILDGVIIEYSEKEVR